MTVEHVYTINNYWGGWKKTKIFFPRKSIEGKYIRGVVYHRHKRFTSGRVAETQYATHEELFVVKLKGREKE